MLINILNILLNNLTFFTGAYSNNIFPDPLPKEEEEIYITKMLQGDKEARAKLIEHNLRLVAHIVKKFESNINDIDDLIGIGTVGLIKGIDSFSPNKNVSLYDGISYDKDGNEVTILDVLKTTDPDFAEEIYKKDNIKLLKEYIKILTSREREVLTKRYGLDGQDEITQKEIAKNLGISRSYVSRIEKRAITKILREFIKNDAHKH